MASVSHEIRTPLTAVVGFMEELRRDWHRFSPVEAKAMVDVVAEQAGEVADIIADLLVAARSNIGTIVVRPERVEVRRQVQAVISRHSGTAASRPIEVQGWVTAIADAGRVRQILRNLLTNAVRYGGSNIRILLYEDLGKAVAEIRDDGLGIDEGSIEQIFEPFARAHSTPSQPESVGLGLWVTKVLAELMNGGIVYCRQGGESVFRLVLPLAD